MNQQDIVVTLPDRINNPRRGKSWIKALTGVDRSRTDGYAFLGDFAGRCGSKAQLKPGTWLLHYDEDVTSTGRLRELDIALYRVGEDGAVRQVNSWTLDSFYRWALEIRDEIADIMTKAEADERAETDPEGNALIALLDAAEADEPNTTSFPHPASDRAGYAIARLILATPVDNLVRAVALVDALQAALAGLGGSVLPVDEHDPDNPDRDITRPGGYAHAGRLLAQRISDDVAAWSRAVNPPPDAVA